MRLLTSFSNLAAPGTLQGVGAAHGAVIDRNHPLSKDLISVILPGTYNDLAATTPITVANAPSNIVPTPERLALDNNTNNGRLVGPVPPTTSPLLTWTNATIFLSGYCLSNSGTLGFGIAGQFGPAGVSFVNFVLGFGGASTPRIAWNNGGALGTLTFNTSFTTGQRYTLAATGVNGGNGAIATFFNGVPDATSTWANAYTTTSPAGQPFLGIGAASVGHYFHLMMLYNRILTNAEILFLHFNPFSMFTSPEGEMPVIFSAAAPSSIFRKTASRIGTRTGTRQTWAA